MNQAVQLIMISLCVRLLSQASEYLEKKAYEWDIVRDVISDREPKTGKDRIWHALEKGDRFEKRTKDTDSTTR